MIPILSSNYWEESKEGDFLKNIISCFLVSGGSLQGRLSEGAEGQGEAEGEVSGAGEEVQKGPQ